MVVMIFSTSSNKTQTIGKNAGEDLDAGTLCQIGAYAPFIDKLSITIAPATEGHAYQMHSAFFTVADDKEVFQSAGAGSKSGGFNRVAMITLASTIDRVRLSIKYAEHKMQKLRLEFNPRKIGETG